MPSNIDIFSIKIGNFMYLTKYLLYLVLCGGKVGGCASLCNMIHKSEDSFQYVLFFYHVGPGH